MAIEQKIEWTLAAAWITVLRADTDLVAAIVAAGGTSANIHREYDLTAEDLLPAVTVRVDRVIPEQQRADGYYFADVVVGIITSMDDDQTGEVRDTLTGGVRDVFETAGLPASLEAAETSIKVLAQGIQQDDPPNTYDIPTETKPTRHREFTFRHAVSMTAAIVDPGD